MRARYYSTMQNGRFAPSPSGRMHLGNVYAALISWLSVKKEGGSWLLRIEDLDRQRCKRQWADQLMDDLAWLGLDWDEGPENSLQAQDGGAENGGNAQNGGGAENGGAAKIAGDAANKNRVQDQKVGASYFQS